MRACSTVHLEYPKFYSEYNGDYVTGQYAASLGTFQYPLDSLMLYPAVDMWWMLCLPRPQHFNELFIVCVLLYTYCILFISYLIPSMLSPAFGDKIVASGGIASLHFDSGEWEKPNNNKIVAIGYATLFQKITRSSFNYLRRDFCCIEMLVQLFDCLCILKYPSFFKELVWMWKLSIYQAFYSLFWFTECTFGT